MAALLNKVLADAGFDVRTAADVLAARRIVDEFDPDAALLDIELGDGPNGLDLAYLLSRQYPHVAVIFLTKHPDLRSAGVAPERVPPDCGFLRKDMISDSEYLLTAINAVLVDEPREYRHDLTPTGPMSGLTQSQVEVLRLAALGLTNAAIARQRGISERAVERTMQGICARWGIETGGEINSRVEAVRRYVEYAGLPNRRT